ncbi:Hypothetical predicted protein, partial [Paramuricea clavata]
MLLKQIKPNVSPIFGFFILLSLSNEEIITATEAADNVTRQFSHEWKAVNEITITQIDSGGGQTWATRIDNGHIFALQNGAWIQIDGLLTHVTVGKSGVWGVNQGDDIFFRQGATPGAPYGIGWRKLDGLLKQIDAGSSGIVYGVD